MNDQPSSSWSTPSRRDVCRLSLVRTIANAIPPAARPTGRAATQGRLPGLT